jgi:hypothetical protein
MILAIDPGTEQSGWCVLTKEGKVKDSGVVYNPKMLTWLHPSYDGSVLAIEMIASYGMPVGRETFETVRWIGRFQQAWRDPEAVRLVYRRDVKLHLCGSMQAKDPHIWQALKDRLGEPGTKKNPGPLYGVTSHARSALAVAVTVYDQLKGELQ